MGGTSTDVALCDAAGLRMTNEASVAGLPVAVQMMDIHTVGAGGGSISRVGGGGGLARGAEYGGGGGGPDCARGRGREPARRAGIRGRGPRPRVLRPRDASDGDGRQPRAQS